MQLVGWWGGLLEDRVIFLTYRLRINYRLLHPLHSQVQPEAAQILAKDRMADWTVSYLVRDGGGDNMSILYCPFWRAMGRIFS